LISGLFFRLRSQRQSNDQIPNFDNVAFVLNALDVLAGDERFVDVRSRRPTFRSLERLDKIYQEATDDMIKARTQSERHFDDEIAKEEEQLQGQLEKLRADTKLKLIDKESRLEILERDIQRRLAAKRQQIELRREKEQKESMRNLNEQVREHQQFYKMCAVVLPPIPPLLIGLIVYFNRRSREQEGVEKSRLR
jgi:ABC-2 type transport system permease protein